MVFLSILGAPQEDLPAPQPLEPPEQDCCRFLRFRITVEPDAGPILLELSGPPGTGEFLSALLNL